MLPKGWVRSTVGDACALRNNLRLPLSAAERAEMRGEYPYFGPTGVLGYIDRYQVDEEFVLIGEDGDHFLKFRERSMTLRFKGKANVNNHAHIIGNSEECLASWFYYWFMHRDLAAVLSRQGVGRYKLTKAGLEELEIWLPPIQEQKRIVKLLDTWESAIVTAERLLAQSHRQKKGLFNRVVRQMTNCQQRPLEDIATRIKSRTDGSDHPVLMISASSGFVAQSEMYSRFMAGKSLDNYVLLKRGEFAYNKGNSKAYEFGCVFPLEKYAQGLVPNVYVCFSMDQQRCNHLFYKYLFESDYLHDQLGALVNTGVRNNGLLNIRPADFMGVRVPTPPLEVQEQIADALHAASVSIRLQNQTVKNLRVQNRALMQQLLTGKRRIGVMQPVVEEPA